MVKKGGWCQVGAQQQGLQACKGCHKLCIGVSHLECILPRRKLGKRLQTQTAQGRMTQQENAVARLCTPSSSAHAQMNAYFVDTAPQRDARPVEGDKRQPMSPCLSPSQLTKPEGRPSGSYTKATSVTLYSPKKSMMSFSDVEYGLHSNTTTTAAKRTSWLPMVAYRETTDAVAASNRYCNPDPAHMTHSPLSFSTRLSSVLRTEDDVLGCCCLGDERLSAASG